VKQRESLFSLSGTQKWQKIKKAPKINDLQLFFATINACLLALNKNIAQALLTYALKQLAQAPEKPIGKGLLGFGKKRSKNRKPLTPAPLYSKVPVQVQ